MRLPIRTLSAFAGLVLAGQAGAEALIGFAAPLSGPSAILGEQMRAGVQMAAETLKDPGITLDIADDACTAEGGARAARQFVSARVRIVVGFLCGEAIEAALPILKQANIPTITVGVRTDSLTDSKTKTGWLVYRLGPRADGEREAAARLLTRLWERELFAIVDDGTIYGRELSESLRLAAEQAGLKPVFVDTFRPQVDNQIGLVGRLKRAGATHVFAGGDRDDIAIMGRDAAELQADLVIAAGETLRAPAGEVPLAAGTLMVALPEWSETADPVATAAFASRRDPDAGLCPAGLRRRRDRACGHRRSQRPGRPAGRQPVWPRFLHRHRQSQVRRKGRPLRKPLSACSASTGRNSFPWRSPDVQDRAAQPHHRRRRPAGRQRLRRRR